jgi:hypothetical protein
MNKPISYPLAKLLKEKGFDEPCPNLYYQPERCKKPTIADVIMWLYEKYGIWVNVYMMDTNIFYWCIDTNDDEYTSDDISFKEPTEAYEAVIEYTLTKLI